MKKNVSPQKETSKNAGLPSVENKIRYNLYGESKKLLGIHTAISESKLPVPTEKVPSVGNEIRYNIYGESASAVGIDCVISESELQIPNAVKSEPLKNFWSNSALGTSKPLKGTLASRISPLALAKRLGFSLCQVFELIEAGSIICRNGLIPAEEAERLLNPKIEKA